MTLKRLIRSPAVDKHHTRFDHEDSIRLVGRGTTSTKTRLEVRRTGRTDGSDLQIETTITKYHLTTGVSRDAHASICADAATAVDFAATIAPELWAVIDTLIYGADRTPDHLQTAIDQALAVVALRKQAQTAGSAL